MKVVYGPTTETRVVGVADRVTRLERRPQLYDIVEEMKICDDVTAIEQDPTAQGSASSSCVDTVASTRRTAPTRSSHTACATRYGDASSGRR